MDSLYLFMVIVLCGADVVSPCLRCFTTPAERENICTYAVSLEKMEAVDCLQRLQRGFEPLNNITIAFPQMHNLKKHLKSFGDEVKKIDKLYFPPAWVEQFEIKMAEFMKGLQDRVASHPAPQCRPPCGRQKEARRYTCSTCTVEECPFPVACPIQETKVIASEKTEIPCGGTFPMPEYPKITWKFAKNTWSIDSSIFKAMDQESGLFLFFNPAVAEHAGTYMCEIVDEDDDIILRSFHYLNVQGTKTDESMRVMNIFNRLMKQATPPTEVEKEENHVPSTIDHISAPFQSHISYSIYAGIGIMVITVVVGVLWRYALSVDW